MLNLAKLFWYTRQAIFVFVGYKMREKAKKTNQKSIKKLLNNVFFDERQGYLYQGLLKGDLVCPSI